MCLPFVCRWELGTEENATAMSGANVYTNSSRHVLHSGAVPHPCASSHTSPVLHSDKSENLEEHLQKD